MQLVSRHPLPEVVDGAKVGAAREGLPAEVILQDAVEVFKALASPVRICILHALSHDELSVGDLARALDLSLSAASHQLALLRRMKLVAARSEGRLTFYRASDDFVGHLVHDCLAHVGRHAADSAKPHHHSHRASPETSPGNSGGSAPEKVKAGVATTAAPRRSAGRRRAR